MKALNLYLLAIAIFCPVLTFAGNIKVGDRVMTPWDLEGKVTSIEGHKAVVHGEWIYGDRFDLKKLIKPTAELDGLRVNWRIHDAELGWGRIVALWADGRIEVSGNDFLAAPYFLKKLKIDDMEAPAVRRRNPLQNFFSSPLTVCQRIFAGSR